ncbi:MAG: damage-inducible protein CinA [Sneathiella sp.]|jgi:nicotinamide-nucleotide amidase|uniref:CinA family protein n=1 Tax=Sneathiella sp. TaxID=1964365 RepID=UPI000C69E6ED|nr:CinA family protein [Sneathiella sp.]MAL79668.1 damage-inducible protein CinA [Sneathiella sp.]|tara:strand:- start:33 stop:536 length:504 start_codon:yes stop_codon:yes gene_type:complete
MGIFESDIEALATDVLAKCRAKKWKLATAESCTGGLIGGALTDIAGSSDVFDRGFVTYSNKAKALVLGVNTETLRSVGAVAEETAREMALGAVNVSGTDIAVAVTGIAGPGSAAPGKPAGLVHLAVATKEGGVKEHRKMLYGDIGRSEVRLATVKTALEMLDKALSN